MPSAGVKVVVRQGNFENVSEDVQGQGRAAGIQVPELMSIQQWLLESAAMLGHSQVVDKWFVS